MARGEEPLLQRAPSDASDDRNVEEEDALLTGQHTLRRDRRDYGWLFWREVGLFAWALVATAAVILLAVLYQHQQSASPGKNSDSHSAKPSGKRNMIFMVSDGMGPTSLSLTRSFRQFESGLPPDDVLALDKHLIGSSRTRSTSSLITDSAAGATAFSCGFKTYNGAISVLPDHSPCGTVMEAAKRAGYMTGLVVTTRITDATPACFAAHVNQRDEEDRIAEQEIGHHPLGRVVDLMLGGGRCHFLPNTVDGSCRHDQKDVIAMARDMGFSYVDDRNGFDGLRLGSAVKLPLLGLFARGDIPYEVDRRNMESTYPSLDEMARTALKALSEATRDSDKGFFLMIEGSRIDHAGHGNDPVAQVHEVLAYDKAFTSVLDFLNEDDTDGVLVGTSDHETGGLSTARQLHKAYPEYLWYPGVLTNASHSGENLAYQLRDHITSHASEPPNDIKTYINEQLLQKGLGVYDATDDEINSILDHPDPWPASYVFADIISRRAQVGWSTHGHSAVDVNIYTSSPRQAKPLIGNHENTEIGEFIRDYLDLDLKAITKELKKKGAAFDTVSEDGETRSWMGKLPSEGKELAGFDHYHGEFKRDMEHGHTH
ncbi:MAG: hypothetical protein M1830_000263 [Pleopsidium flavum]|nr:MAG: hypothetical protein M1830_000263 [Pleopsidium flavum]